MNIVIKMSLCYYQIVKRKGVEEKTKGEATTFQPLSSSIVASHHLHLPSQTLALVTYLQLLSFIDIIHITLQLSLPIHCCYGGGFNYHWRWDSRKMVEIMVVGFNENECKIQEEW